MPLLSVADAQTLIVGTAAPFDVERVPLARALGLALAEPVVSAIDSPPFDKSLMDGYAVRTADLGRVLLAGGSREGTSDVVSLRVIEEVPAGRVPRRTVEPGTATRIMTGAPIPSGADTVIPVEATTFDAASETMTTSAGARPGHNILRRATSVAAGQTVLPAGRLLRAQELGALAELGIAIVPARRRPRIAVLATGDELVDVSESPGPGQIRNSNETMLVGQIEQAGGVPVPLGVARDERTALRAKIAEGLKADLFLLTGGVSAGKFDLVPSELEAAGVRTVFHKVDVKPGKPVWFGAAGPAERPTCLVFGLPGNPVSSLVCFELFVRPAIRRRMGIEPAVPPPVRARLGKSHVARGDRPTYHPARLDWTDAGPVATPTPWHGSSDLCGTLAANAMALFAAGDAEHAAGTIVDVFPW